MRIAIISMQRVVNYGSVLQAFSLRHLLEQITGEKVDFLDIDYSKSVKCLSEKPNDNVCNPYHGDGLYEGIKRKIFRKKRKENDNLICQFMHDDLNIDSARSADNYDIVIVGSDEVFNNTHNPSGLSLQLYGEIECSSRCFTYAAASGEAKFEDIPVECIDIVKAALSNFEEISVRDEATRNYISKLYTGTISHHLDPVLVGPLRGRNHKKVSINKYMIVYSYNERIRDPKEIEAIKKYAKDKGLLTVSIGGVQYWCDRYIALSPFEMLDYFYYADCIVTDTFHGTIFSVITNRKFGVFLRNSNRNKIEGLLDDLKLQSRIIDDLSFFENIMDTEIYYEDVNGILEQETQKSINYLKRMCEYERDTK